MIRQKRNSLCINQGSTDIVAASFTPILFRSILFIAAFFCAPFGALANNLNANANYVVTLRGVNISTVSVGFKDNGQNYSVNILGDVTGLASLVAAGTARFASSGNSSGDQLQSERFELETIANDQTFNVMFQANQGNVTSSQVIPPLSQNKNRVPIVRKHRQNINDPIASFFLKADRLEPALCDRQLKVYTGVERYNIDLKFAKEQTATSKATGYQGPVILCTMRYNPISGHFTNSDTTTYMQSNQRFLIWYAPLGQSGYMIPYRVLVGTAFGDLSMVLTRLNY